MTTCDGVVVIVTTGDGEGGSESLSSNNSFTVISHSHSSFEDLEEAKDPVGYKLVFNIIMLQTYTFSTAIDPRVWWL